MTPVQYMTLVAALLLTAAGSSLRSDEQKPLTTPTRDVDITYQIARPGQPAIVERRRWLASQQLRRVDGPDKSATIFDQKTGGFTLLNTANHTYRTLDTPKRMSPQKGSILKRSGDSKIAGLNCIDWSWLDDTELRTACLTLYCCGSSSMARPWRRRARCYSPRSHLNFLRFRLVMSQLTRRKVVRWSRRPAKPNICGGLSL